MSQISLTRYLREQQRVLPALDDALIRLLEQVAQACIGISQALGQGALADLLGAAGQDNVQGEAQKKLDVLANDLLIDAHVWGGHLAAMASEEMDELYTLPDDVPRGDYLLAFDPLDGSSNIDVNVSVGTIFSVLRAPQRHAVTAAHMLQAGRAQVAAGYAIYGPATQWVLTLGAGVDVFTLDRSLGQFFLTERGVRIPEQTQEFAINMSNQRFWEAPVQRYVAELLAGREGVRGKDFNMRWVGSMVADVHRLLTRGGLFMYPIDAKTRAKGGRLRLLYEANPMAWLVEQAGGLASTGYERILDLSPQALHQRVPVMLGAREEVLRLEDLHRD